MPHRRAAPPWEYLLNANETSLHSYELSRLGHASNLRKEIAALIDEWLEETAAALLARCLLERLPLLHNLNEVLPEPLALEDGEDEKAEAPPQPARARAGRRASGVA